MTIVSTLAISICIITLLTFYFQVGVDTGGDRTLNEIAKILRVLHIEELRQLQTRINEAIVSGQIKTADPKTDTKLGQVGR